MLTERNIINFLIWVGALIVGPYLAVSAVSGNLLPMGVALGLAFLVLFFGVMKDGMAFLPLIGLYWAGRINLIPLRLGPSDACAAALIFYYLIAYSAMRRKLVKTGPRYFFIPILIIGAIVLYHEHNFGLRAMGGGREGGRGAVLMLTACFAYFCGVSVDTPSRKYFQWLPLITLLVCFISTISYAVTTYFPQTAPLFFIFTDNINGTAYKVDMLGGEGVVRSQGQAIVASSIITILVSYFPIFTWWRPSRWWIILVSAGCAALVLLGGFRSGLADVVLEVIVGTWCYYSWRTILILPIGALAIFLAISANDSHLIKLPTSAQRTLSFLPGNWDKEVLTEAESSNDFRDKIKKVYIKEDAAKSPLFGNGLTYDSDEFARYNYLALTQETPDGYYGTKIYVTGKIFHVGWISVYDSIGLIGMAVFIFLGLAMIFVVGRMIFGAKVDRNSELFPLRVWIFCSIVPAFVGYFTLYGDVKVSFAAYCYFSILITHLIRLDKNLGTIAPPQRMHVYQPIHSETLSRP